MFSLPNIKNMVSHYDHIGTTKIAMDSLEKRERDLKAKLELAENLEERKSLRIELRTLRKQIFDAPAQRLEGGKMTTDSNNNRESVPSAASRRRVQDEEDAQSKVAAERAARRNRRVQQFQSPETTSTEEKKPARGNRFSSISVKTDSSVTSPEPAKPVANDAASPFRRTATWSHNNATTANKANAVKGIGNALNKFNTQVGGAPLTFGTSFLKKKEEVQSPPVRQFNTTPNKYTPTVNAKRNTMPESALNRFSRAEPNSPKTEGTSPGKTFTKFNYSINAKPAETQQSNEFKRTAFTSVRTNNIRVMPTNTNSPASNRISIHSNGVANDETSYDNPSSPLRSRETETPSPSITANRSPIAPRANRMSMPVKTELKPAQTAKTNGYVKPAEKTEEIHHKATFGEKKPQTATDRMAFFRQAAEEEKKREEKQKEKEEQRKAKQAAAAKEKEEEKKPSSKPEIKDSERMKNAAPCMKKREKKKVTRRTMSIGSIVLDWVQEMIRDYPVEVTNFSSSWNNGMVFCALIHRFNPTEFDFSKLKPENKRENFDLAFETGKKVKNIPMLLDTDDMVKLAKPEPRSVQCYVQWIWSVYGPTSGYGPTPQEVQK